MSKNDRAKKIFKIMDDFLGNYTQIDILKWESDITAMRDELHLVIEEVKTGEIDTLAFKDDYLMKKMWTINGMKGSDLWPKIMALDNDELYTTIISMIDYAEDNKDNPNQAIVEGRITGVLGKRILSEILHRYFIYYFPVFDSKSIFGLIWITNPIITKGSDYSEFIKSCNNLYSSFKEWFVNRDLELKDEFKYYYLDRLFLAVYESPKYSEKRKMAKDSQKMEWN